MGQTERREMPDNLSEGQPPVHERYADRYARDQSVAMSVAAEVCGHELAESGYTTRIQVDRLVSELELGISPLVLDVGSGRGWPAAYVADVRPNWRVIASDVPTGGLALIRPSVSGAVGASAAALPFHDHVFDAVLHTDVFC